MLLVSVLAGGQPVGRDDLPFVGAQVFIEPGQSPERIDGWFAALQQAGLNVCRIRMFESYMRTESGWDFSLFDQALRSAEKHGVGVYCTLFPATSKTDIGGWKFPYDKRQQESFAEFIRALTDHYKDAPALKGWVLLNEPGGDAPRTPFGLSAREDWDRKHSPREFTDQGYPVLMDLRDARFRLDLNTAFLDWIAREVRAVDPRHDLHVNPHAIFYNLSQYDFPGYRDFLTSLGGSAHAAWHFGLFQREEYALAMLAQSEILRSGAGPLPWLMTEIQGGNNTYSGGQALCPTPEEIRQWLWAVIGCEGKGGIFWMLNPRSSGIEAGEWAMLDFQDRPSARLLTASEVASTLSAHPEIFSSLREIPSGIDILYFREAFWAEKKMAVRGDVFEGRQDNAVMKSVLSCFRALSECGVNVGIRAFEEYTFDESDYTGRTLVVPNQIAVPEAAMAQLERFVRLGGTLIAEGLTFFFDEHLHARVTDWTSGFPSSRVSEYILKSPLFIRSDGLPVHLWEGTISGTGNTLSVEKLGKGKMIWIPSCIALGARVADDYAPLASFLLSHAPLSPDAVAFDGYERGVLLRSLKTASGNTILICINKSGASRTVRFRGVSGKGEVLFAEGASFLSDKACMNHEGTLVLCFRSL